MLIVNLVLLGTHFIIYQKKTIVPYTSFMRQIFHYFCPTLSPNLIIYHQEKKKI